MKLFAAGNHLQTMNVVLFGASGMIGRRILKELLTREHGVESVVRHPEKLKSEPGDQVRVGDILNPESVAETATGMDAAISAYAPPQDDQAKLLDATRSLIEGLKKAGVRRLLMVGGAGSLEVSPGVQLIDTPSFPAAWKSIAEKHREALDILKASDLDWTSFSPAAFIEPGERTGKFRVGTDQLIVDEKGESRISAEDYAVALVDELEKSEHVKARFTVGY